MTVSWYRITAPHFVAGIRFTDGVADHSAPILRGNLGKTAKQVSRLCRQRGYKFEFLAFDEANPQETRDKTVDEGTRR
jgi:hypothetical protein